MAEKIFLSSPTMHGDEQEFIKLAFDTNWVAPLGANVDGFENDVAEFSGAGFAAALSSGTAALHLALKLAGVKRNDIVLCSDMTFSATVNPVSYEGGKQVFIDSERDTWNMDPKALQAAFDKYDGVNLPKPKAVVVVNLYGVPAKLDEIKAICDKYGVPLIEDAAESMSAKYNGKQTGTFGKYGVFSFNGNKIITTSGGGMLVSDSEEDIKKARFWATQSRDPAPHYQHSEIGYNYRMSNIVAGIGRGQIKHIEEHKALKTEIYKRYSEAFKDVEGVTLNPYLDCMEPNFWLTCIYVDSKTGVKPYDIMDRLAEENIEARPIWKPMHMQPVFADCDFIKVEDSAVNEDIFAHGLCLPSDVKMSPDSQQKVIDIIKSFF